MNFRYDTSVQEQQAASYIGHVCYRMTENSLKSCQISNPCFSNDHAKLLASAVATNKKLRKLEIIKCPQLTGRGIADICNALRHSAVSHLSFEDITVGDDGLEAIRRLLLEGGCSIKFLGLENIGVISGSVLSSFLGVASRKLESLDLSRNSLTAENVIEIADGLAESNSLTALILSENTIGDEGMERICRALGQNRSLMLLAVGDCKITNRGIHALALALRHNSSLQRLYMYGNAGVDLSSNDNVEIRYWLALNSARRAFLRSNHCRTGYVPSVLARSRSNPELLYGLLKELPHVWAISTK